MDVAIRYIYYTSPLIHVEHVLISSLKTICRGIRNGLKRGGSTQQASQKLAWFEHNSTYFSYRLRRVVLLGAV